MIRRREFLAGGTSAIALCGLPSFSATAIAEESRPARGKAPFRALYSNDTTNITSCISPFHKAREPFRPEMLEATVDELQDTGIEVHLLQPGLGMVPMWPSKVLSLEEHYRWVKERYGVDPDTFGRYVMAGGDVVKVFIERCRLRGQAPFISFRLNDAHNKEFAEAKKSDKIGGGAAMSLTRFFVEHPEYRIGPDLKSSMQRLQNWAIPEVRAHKFAFLKELCENNDLDGLELDYLRFHSYFPQDRTTVEQRCAIMCGFVREVRELLDRTARGGRTRWLCARVPCYVKAFDPMGLDLPGMVEAGLDMVNVSASYFTVQQNDLATIRQMVPSAALYLELCHSIWNGDKLTPGYDTFTFRRTTPEQFYTAAHLAYARGADGVSAFNFAYYREHGGPGRGPFTEPPFEIFQHLRDQKWLALQPQHYFLAPGWNNPFIRPPLLPRKLVPTEPLSFSLDLAPPTGGWQPGGRLRIQCEAPLAQASFQVQFNGQSLEPSPDVSEPYPAVSPSLLGKPEAMRAWHVPAKRLRDGQNQLGLTMLTGMPNRLDFMDLAVR